MWIQLVGAWLACSWAPDWSRQTDWERERERAGECEESTRTDNYTLCAVPIPPPRPSPPTAKLWALSPLLLSYPTSPKLSGESSRSPPLLSQTPPLRVFLNSLLLPVNLLSQPTLLSSPSLHPLLPCAVSHAFSPSRTPSCYLRSRGLFAAAASSRLYWKKLLHQGRSFGGRGGVEKGRFSVHGTLASTVHCTLRFTLQCTAYDAVCFCSRQKSGCSGYMHQSGFSGQAASGEQ